MDDLPPIRELNDAYDLLEHVWDALGDFDDERMGLARKRIEWAMDAISDATDGGRKVVRARGAVVE